MCVTVLKQNFSAPFLVSLCQVLCLADPKNPHNSLGVDQISSQTINQSFSFSIQQDWHRDLSGGWNSLHLFRWMRVSRYVSIVARFPISSKHSDESRFYREFPKFSIEAHHRTYFCTHFPDISITPKTVLQRHFVDFPKETIWDAPFFRFVSLLRINWNNWSATCRSDRELPWYLFTRK